MRELIELEEQKLATMKALLKAYQMQQTAIKRGVL
jgi:hypothetical protein